MRRMPQLGRFGGFSRDQVTLEIEDIVDGGMGGSEALSLTLGFEPLHLSLASSDGEMAVFDPIVVAQSARLMPVLALWYLERSGVRGEAVGDDPLWDCQDFRVRAGIMGKKESLYVPTQGAGNTADLLDQLLAGGDAAAALQQGGLLDTFKNALAERALHAEVDHPFGHEGQAGNNRNG